jgi:hypothetical protein
MRVTGVQIAAAFRADDRIDEGRDVAYLSARRHLRRHGDQHSLASDECYQSQAPMIGSTRAMKRRLYQYLIFACRLGYLLPMIVLAIIFAMWAGDVIDPDEWKDSPRVIRWTVTTSWTAFFWFSIWVVFIEPALSPVMADVLKGILCCALIAGGVATIVRWLIGLRLTERIRASARLDAMVRRNHRP